MDENAEQKKPNPEVRVAGSVDARFKSRQNHLLLLEVWIVSSYLSGGMEASGVLVRLCFLGYTGVFSCENVSSCQLMVCMYIC